MNFSWNMFDVFLFLNNKNIKGGKSLRFCLNKTSKIKSCDSYVLYFLPFLAALWLYLLLWHFSKPILKHGVNHLFSLNETQAFYLENLLCLWFGAHLYLICPKWPETVLECQLSCVWEPKRLNIPAALVSNLFTVPPTGNSASWVRRRLPSWDEFLFPNSLGGMSAAMMEGYRAGNTSQLDNPLWHSRRSKMASSSFPPLHCHKLTSSDPVTSGDYLQTLQNLSLGYLLAPVGNAVWLCYC